MNYQNNFYDSYAPTITHGLRTAIFTAYMKALNQQTNCPDTSSGILNPGNCKSTITLKCVSLNISNVLSKIILCHGYWGKISVWYMYAKVHFF